jgi:BirA family biotin operon repressor/biotin-[acetyl-CoA-carboxylase] ligase
MNSSTSKGQFAGLVELAEVDSTNKELLRRLDSETPEFFAVTADKQTAGLGRLGRNWVTEAGKSLAVSILLRPTSRSQTDWITIMAGLALSSALEKHGLVVSLKWPNDLLVDGKKLSGILAEMVDLNTVVLGIGINIKPQEHSPDTATSLQELGLKIEKDELLEVIATELKSYWFRLKADSKTAIAQFQAELLTRCGTLGTRVRAELPGGKNIYGVAIAIDETGRLIVQAPEPVALAAADVWHLRN